MREVSHRPSPILTYVLRDDESEVEVCPTRGALVTRFRAHGRTVLALDEVSLLDKTKNVRGGIPVLFPIAGPLPGDAWDHGGRRFPLGQHGFARALPWDVLWSEAEPEPRITLLLEASGATFESFPFDFRAEHTVRLRAGTLRLDLAYSNRSPEAMPFHLGFHPYFTLPDREKKSARVPTAATRAWDNVEKREVALPAGGIDLAASEVDLHLLDHGAAPAALERPDGSRVVVSASDDFRHWVVWTLAGRDFVCLEPWTAPAGALASGRGLLEIAPGETRRLWVEIAVLPAPASAA